MIILLYTRIFHIISKLLAHGGNSCFISLIITYGPPFSWLKVAYVVHQQ